MSMVLALRDAVAPRDPGVDLLAELPPLRLPTRLPFLPAFATRRWSTTMPAALRKVPRAPVEMFDVFALRAAATGPYLLVRYGLVLSQLPDAPVDEWSYVATLNADLDQRVRMGAPVFKELERYGFHLTWTSPL